jgi:hypothetical protein
MSASASAQASRGRWRVGDHAPRHQPVSAPVGADGLSTGIARWRAFSGGDAGGGPAPRPPGARALRGPLQPAPRGAARRNCAAMHRAAARNGPPLESPRSEARQGAGVGDEGCAAVWALKSRCARQADRSGRRSRRRARRGRPRPPGPSAQGGRRPPAAGGAPRWAASGLRQRRRWVKRPSASGPATGSAHRASGAPPPAAPEERWTHKNRRCRWPTLA